MADKLDTFLAISSEALQAEEAVKDRLAGGAQKYLAVIGVILGFHVVELKELSFSGEAAHKAFLVAVLVGLGLLFVAMATVLWGMRVRRYPTFPRSNDLQRVGTAATDDEAKSLAANVYLDLRDAIKAVNEKRASTLRIAGIILLAGFVVTVLGQLGLGLKFR